MATMLPFEKYTRVWWVPTIADISAPTTTEVAAGTDISCMLTKDGLAFNISTGSIDASTLCQSLNATEPGSVDIKPHVKGYRYTSTDDDLWDLIVWNTAGHLVVRPMVATATAAAAAQKVMVFKGKWGEKQPINTAANTMNMVEADFFVNDYNLLAALAA